jgi:DNA topoisomerase-3
MLGNVAEVTAVVADLLEIGINKPKKGSDAGDHPPITPMRAVSSRDLDSDSQRVYIYIVKHFLASVSF